MSIITWMKKTSLHWHGLFLPNKMDGVPFLHKCL
ncbi:multicopper oxidase domain-containing protein [Pedobacter fastidiosus]